jgi:signal transduction histidine kinase
LEQFAYITSHDLQEPLRKIQTFADLTEQNLTDISTSKKYLVKISQAALRMSLLIKDVLSYSRLTIADEKFIKVDLNELIHSVLEDFELMIEQRRAKIEIENMLPVKGLSLQLLQLFSNLLSNSLKFCERDPIITIRSEKVEKKNARRIRELSNQYNYVKITFTDNGIGFDQQYADKIFTIFQRLNHRKLYAGTGIGLALCKRIVENHRGAIFASSSLDCGATFEIYLPAFNS